MSACACVLINYSSVIDLLNHRCGRLVYIRVLARRIEVYPADEPVQATWDGHSSYINKANRTPGLQYKLAFSKTYSHKKLPFPYPIYRDA